MKLSVKVEKRRTEFVLTLVFDHRAARHKTNANY